MESGSNFSSPDPELVGQNIIFFKKNVFFLWIFCFFLIDNLIEKPIDPIRPGIDFGRSVRVSRGDRHGKQKSVSISLIFFI